MGQSVNGVLMNESIFFMALTERTASRREKMLKRLKVAQQRLNDWEVRSKNYMTCSFCDSKIPGIEDYPMQCPDMDRLEDPCHVWCGLCTQTEMKECPACKCWYCKECALKCVDCNLEICTWCGINSRHHRGVVNLAQ